MPSPHQNLCDWCYHRCERLIPKYYREPYAEDCRTFDDTHKGAEDGCQICALLSAGLTVAFGKTATKAYHIFALLIPSLDKKTFTLEFRANIPQKLGKSGSSSTRYSKRFEFCGSPGTHRFVKGTALATVDDGFLPSPLDALRFIPQITVDTREEECTFLVNEWISTCDRNHSACERQHLSFLPRRIIDVGSDNPEQPPTLYECENERGRYIALSHCWGKSQHFITETTNIEERRSGMTWDSLPKTFQDAISLTRRLRVQFIWIDSLCIIQDDSADWERELSKMSDIYKNSFLTIAAESAENDQAGFLGSRLWNNPVGIPAGYNVPEGLCIREVIGDDASPSYQEPLTKRAWAFQERLISQRILSFRAGGMKWGCNDSTWTESGHEPRSFASATVGNRALYHSILRNTHRSKINCDDSKVYSWWRESIVPAYARLSLTKEEDRLPALSAIATEVQMKTKDTYLAGLWKRDLFQELLWRSCSSETSPRSGSISQLRWPQPGRLPSRYRAPSWSWASIETSCLVIEEQIAIDNFLARVLDVSCRVLGTNPTGKVSDGFIKLACRWTRAVMNIGAVSGTSTEFNLIYSFDAFPMWEDRLSHHQFFFPDVPLVERQFKVSDNEDTKIIQRSDLVLGHSHPAMSGVVSCILLARTPSGHLIFMVLGHSLKRTGVFERLGILKLHHRFLRDNWYDDLSLGVFVIV